MTARLFQLSKTTILIINYLENCINAIAIAIAKIAKIAKIAIALMKLHYDDVIIYL